MFEFLRSFLSRKSHYRKPAKRRCRFEALETRAMMTGNVVVQVVPDGSGQNDLVVTGDGASNGVEITQVAPGTFAVSGRDHYGATTVNGWYTTRYFYNVSDDVIVRMNGGHDWLQIGGYSEATRDYLPDDLNIDLGSGNDTVNFYAVVCRDDMTINTGDNWDTVNVNYVTVGDVLSINTGAGNDTVRVNQIIADELYAELGSESDYISIRNNRFNRMISQRHLLSCTIRILLIFHRLLAKGK